MGVNSVSCGVVGQTSTLTVADSPEPEAAPVISGAPAATSSFGGPTGSVKQGDASYEVSNGQVSLNGAVIGTVNDAGDYAVKINGQDFTGNVAGLIGATISGTLSDGTKIDNRPTGEVDLGGTQYMVKAGEVSVGGKKVGTINDSGDFDVNGVTGNVASISGAIYNGSLSDSKAVDNRASGVVHFGDADYAIRQGRVFDPTGHDVGTIDEKGGFQVTIDGRQYAGSLPNSPALSYDGRLANGRYVKNAPTGLVSVAGKDYQVVGGKVFSQGQRIGSVTANGDFNVTIDGKHQQGTVANLHPSRVIVTG